MGILNHNLGTHPLHSTPFSKWCRQLLFILLQVHIISSLDSPAIVHVLKPDLQKPGNRPWEKVNRRRNEIDCDCGFDPVLEDGKEELNNPEKKWLIYVHVLNAQKVFLRTCTGTIINSKMVLTSHTCLKIRNRQTNLHLPISQANLYAKKENIVVSFTSFYTRQVTGITVNQVLHHPDFLASDTGNTVPVNDVAVVVMTNEFAIGKDVTPICLTKEQILNRLPIGYRGYFYGVGSDFKDDSSPEYRAVGNVVVMSGYRCDETKKFATRNSYCVQYRFLAPPNPGGPLVMSQNATVNSRGYTPGHTVFLMGISSVARVRQPDTSIVSTYFSGIIPVVRYLQYQAHRFNAKWCKIPGPRPFFRPAVSNVEPGSGILQKYEWEGSRAIKRDESLDCVCGLHNLEKSDSQSSIVTGRIAGGEEADRYEFPWMTAIFSSWNKLPEEETDTFASCGGSIINDRMILTAAHCVFEESRLPTRTVEESLADHTEIYYRIHEINGDSQEKYAKVGQVYPNLDFVESSKQNIELNGDLAVIILDSPLNFSTATKHADVAPGDVRPICLPRPNRWVDVVGRDAVVAGWGITPPDEESQHPALWEQAKVLQKLTIPMVPLVECAKRADTPLQDTVLCGGFWNRSRDTTQGDSGGPVNVRQSGGYWTQIGIGSFSEHSFDYEDYYEDSLTGEQVPRYLHSATLYTNVQKFLRFIDYYAQKTGAKWCKSFV